MESALSLTVLVLRAAAKISSIRSSIAAASVADFRICS